MSRTKKPKSKLKKKLNVKSLCLFKPKSAPISTPLRLRGRAHHPKWGGLGGKALDKKLIWSRFKSTSSNVRTTHLDFGTTARLWLVQTASLKFSI